MSLLKKIINFYYGEYKLYLSGFHDILTNISFFFISIFIFIFSVGPSNEQLSLLGIGIIWTLLLLSSTLSLRKFYQDDFESGNIVLLYINGFSCILIDDYGHHPSEIRSTIESIRESFPDKEVNMVFQPHRFSRTKDLFSEFVEVLTEVDNLILLEVYSAGERPIKEINSKELVKRILEQGFDKVKLLTNGNEIIKSVDEIIINDSVLIMQGAGNISDISSELKRRYLD